MTMSSGLWQRRRESPKPSAPLFLTSDVFPERGITVFRTLSMTYSTTRSLVSLGIPPVYGNKAVEPNKTGHKSPATSLIRLRVWESQVTNPKCW